MIYVKMDVTMCWKVVKLEVKTFQTRKLQIFARFYAAFNSLNFVVANLTTYTVFHELFLGKPYLSCSKSCFYDKWR